MTNTKDSERVELQDLGNGRWRIVCGDRSCETEVRDGDLWIDHRRLARFAAGEDHRAPGHLLERIQYSLVIDLITENGLCRETRHRNDGKPGKKREVVWIRRREALLILTQCTAWSNAIKLTQKMAEVFEQYLDRRYAANHETNLSLVTELRQVLTEQRDEIQALRAENVEIRKLLASGVSSHGLISLNRRREILDTIQFFADCFYGRKSNPTEWRKKRAWFEKEAKKACLLPMGVAWDRLPMARNELVENKLRDFRECIPEEVRRQRRAERDHAKQMTLHAVN